MPKRLLASLAVPVLILAVLSCPVRAASPGVERLLAAMSPEEKIGQMLLVFFKGPDLSPELSAMVAERSVGGVILYSAPGNIESPQQVARLTASIQALAAKTPRGVGLIVGVDQEGGPVVRLRQGVTRFPSQMAVGATGNREHARAMARVMAQELRTLGINCNFAPVADVNANPANPVIGIRSFGSEPAAVSRLTAAMVEEYNRARMLCTPKHFPGHGDTDVDSHLGLPVSNHDLRTLDRVDFQPFRAAIAAGAPAVMTAHMAVPALDPTPGLPATLSAKVLGGVLRGQLRFGGLIITDSLGMGALDRTYGLPESALRAAKAGADILLLGADVGHDPDEHPAVYDRLLAALKSGELPAARVDEAVRRILEAKATCGILEAKAIPDQSAEIPFLLGSPENREVARAIAEDSITLLRDLRKQLPLKPGGKLLVVWPQRTPDDPVETLASLPGATVLRPGREPSGAEIRQAAQAAAQADAVLVLTSDATRNPAQQTLVRTLASARNQRIILAAVGGPYDLALFPDVPTALATYGDAQPSLEALAKGLMGGIPLRGRLPVRLQ